MAELCGGEYRAWLRSSQPKGGLGFRSSLFSPRESVGLKTLTQAVQQLEDLTGEEVDVEEGAIAAAFKKLAAEELERLYPLKATAEANGLPILPLLSEFQQTLLGIQSLCL